MELTRHDESAPDPPTVRVRRGDSLIAGVDIVIPAAGADLEAVERALIVFALEMTDANRTRAARFLRLSRSALIYRMHKHGVAQRACANPSCHKY